VDDPTALPDPGPAGPPVTLPELAARFMLGEVGQEEVPRGSNWGPRVSAYLRVVGLDFPAPWCAAAVCWGIAGARDALRLVVPVRFRFSARALGLLEVNPDLVLPADSDEYPRVIVWDHGGGLGHCGIELGVLPDGDLDTVEGNTSPSGSREGYGMFRHDFRRPDDPRIAGRLRIA
jgi:hypothetical protein